MLINRKLSLILIIILSSCHVEEVPYQGEEILTVEGMLSRRANHFIDIGETEEEILGHLSEVIIYNDILQFIKERGQKNNVECRKLDFETFQFVEDIWTKEGKRINLIYLVKNDTVQFGVIESIDSNYITVVEKTEFKRNSSFIQAYLDNHNRIYSASKTTDDFIHEIINTIEEIRIACGYLGTGYGHREKKLFQEIKKKNKTYIIHLLSSMNPEEQVMGIIGMRKLMETDIRFKKEKVQIIDHILKKNTAVYACITCIYDLYKLDKYLSGYDWSKIPNIPIE